MTFLSPLLLGANLRDRLIAGLGALFGIAITALVCGYLTNGTLASALIVAPMGASAVLLFAVPASPLAQPWPIIGGNSISAIVGLIIGHLVPNPGLAAGLAVGLGIVVMALTRSLHPPGGAMALGSALGGKAIADWGLLYPFFPVAVNALLLVAVGIAWHRLGSRNYPHRPLPAPANTHKTMDPPPAQRLGFAPEDVAAVLASMHESFDIDTADLEALLANVERHALQRARPDLTCGALMSRDVVSVDVNAPATEALDLMRHHRLYRLPVTDNGRLKGKVDALTLAEGRSIKDTLLAPLTARADDPAFAYLPGLMDGSGRNVVVVDADDAVLGILTQTDMLAALARLVPAEETKFVTGQGTPRSG